MFAGVVIRGSRKSPYDYATPQVLVGALTPYEQADVTGQWSSDRALIVQALTWNTTESQHETTPEICTKTGRVISSWVRLDNRSDLCVDLNLKDTPTLTDPQIILAAHAKWGNSCADNLEGDYSFVIYDPATAVTFCARDCVGAKPLYYFADEEVFIFASTAAVFPHMRNIRTGPSQDWLAQYFANVSHHRVKSAFESVLKLPSAHHLTVVGEGPVAPKQYFEFKDRSPFAAIRNPKWVSHYRDVFDQVVSDRLRSSYLIGAENSGGIDSSTIIASACAQLPHSINDFHLFGLSHLAREPEYILETPTYLGIEQNHIITAPSYFRTDEVALRGIRTLGYPSENGLATLYHRFLEEAQLHDIRTILSGFGGDEIVTSKGEKFAAELYASHSWRLLLRELPGMLPFRLARLARLVGQTGREQVGLAKEPTAHWQRILNYLEPEALRELGLIERTAERPADISGPSMNRLAITKLSHPRFGGEMAGRLEGFSLLAQSYGISYRWPMLDRRLIQQFLDTPTIEKKHRSIGRYMHRLAFDGDVPAKVLWKRSKAMGVFTNLDRQEPHDVNLLLEDLPAQLADFVAVDVVRALGPKLRKHRNGEAPMPLEEYSAAYMTIKNLMELKLFLNEWSG